MQESKGREQWRCDDCDTGFNSQDEWKNHRSREHEEEEAEEKATPRMDQGN